MPLRDTLLNLAITAVLVLIVVLGGILLKESRPAPPAAVPVKLAGVPGESLPSEGGWPKEVEEKFLIFPRPTLVESRANEADTLRIRLGNDEHIFVLYFVDALEASMNHPQKVAEQARYFGRTNERVITSTGVEAAAYVTELLKTHPFEVITRWERVPNTLRYYALIRYVREDGQRVYLMDLLLRKGYAWLNSVDTPLPGDTRDLPTYYAELKSLARKAREEKQGVWAKIATP
jgi:endonuclease YncB( thermonuclease family)